MPLLSNTCRAREGVAHKVVHRRCAKHRAAARFPPWKWITSSRHKLEQVQNILCFQTLVELGLTLRTMLSTESGDSLPRKLSQEGQSRSGSDHRWISPQRYKVEQMQKILCIQTVVDLPGRLHTMLSTEYVQKPAPDARPGPWSRPPRRMPPNCARMDFPL